MAKNDVTKYHGKTATDDGAYVPSATGRKTLSKVDIGGVVYDLKDAQARQVIDAIYEDYLRSTDKAELLTEIAKKVDTTTYEAKVAELVAADATLDVRITAIEEDYLKAKDKTELEGLIDAEEAARKAADEAEEAARDKAIEDAIKALDVTDTAEDGKYVSAVNEVDGKVVVTRASLPAEIKYTMVRQETPETGMASTYYLTKDGVQEGAKINIPKDQFLKEAKFYATKADAEADGKTVPTGTEFPALYFLFEQTSGDAETWIPVKTLVDVYTAGDGIAITGNEISVVVDPTSETFLTVGEDGLKLSGVQTAINTAVAGEAALRSAADTELDGKITAEVTRATGKEAELTTAISNEVTRATGKEDGLATAISDEASRAKAAEEELATAISDEETRAKAAEEANAEAIEDLDDRLTTAESEIDALQADSHTHANKAELDKIASGDKAKWDKAVTDLAAEIERATEAEDALDDKIDAEASRADTAEKAIADDLADEVTRATGVENGLNTRLTAAEADIDAIEAKEDDWDAKLDNVKLNGNFVAVKSDVEGKGNYVDLGNIATTDGVVANVSYEDASHTLKQQKGESTSSVHQFGDLADENLANLEVKGQTADVDFTKNEVKVNEYAIADAANATAADITSTSVTASHITNAAAVKAATFTEGAFTANVPTKLDLSKFNGGSAATFTQGSKASLTDATSAKFVKKGVSFDVDEATECLTLSYVADTDTNFYANAVTDRGTFTANGDDTFNGGSAASLETGFYTEGSAASKAADTFDGGTMPTFEDATATNVTGVTYVKQVLNPTEVTKTVDATATVTTVDKAVTKKA